MLPILNQSFWRDEAFSVLLSEKSPWQIITLTIKDQSPPFYSLILHYWMLLFGQSEVAIRGLSFLFHICLVITVFFITKKLIHSFTAQILITASTLFNPFLLQYAFEARMYSLLALLTILSVYFIFLKKNWLAGITLSLGILTHNFGLFNFTAVFVWWIYVNKTELKKNFKNGLSIFLIPVITIVLWGLVIWNQWVRVGKGFWIKQATSQIFIDSFQKYSQGDIFYPSQHMMFLLSLILFFFALSYWIWKKNQEESSIPSLLFSVGLIPVVITYLISAIFVPIYHERYLIATAPMLIIISGYSLYQTFLQNPSRRLLIVAFVSAYMSILILSSEQIVNSTTKPAINWAVKNIVSLAQPGDVIIPKDVLNYLETKFYVEKSGKNIPVFAYSPTGEIPFYIGAILFDKQHIITSIPKNRRIWQIEPDGGYKLLNSKS